MGVLARNRIRLGGGLALAALAGCVLVDALFLRERPLEFSHELHVQREGLSCENCHEDFAVSADPGMPWIDTCLFCHEELDEAQPVQRRIATLFDAEDRFLARRWSRLDDELVFDHLQHVEGGLDCADCHAGIEQNVRLDASIGVSMTECMDCHDVLGVANDCRTCHTVYDQDVAPETHGSAWERLHGQAARFPTGAMIDTCSNCHTESSCTQCHLEQKPTSHNAHWRLRGHSISARLDRGSCAACHEPQSCDRCHAETLPLSHTGTFASTQSTHCLGCHFPLQSNGCVTCHKGTPSHFLAPPKPAWHNPAMNCRQCHGRGLPLSHVDKGDNCNICHF